MAFTQEQKKQLSFMVDSPEEFLHKCQNNLIYLPSFKNEFFQDGSGIFHILSECIVNSDKEIYVEIVNHVLKNTDLNLFQYSGRKQSAFSLLIDGLDSKNDNKESLTRNITNFIILNRDKKSDSINNYLIGTYLTKLASLNEVEQLNSIMEIYPNFKIDFSINQSLLKSAIDTNNKEVVKVLISNDMVFNFLNEKIGEFQFNIEPPNHTAKNVNIYSYAIKKNSPEILNLLMDTFKNKINYDGTKKEKNPIYSIVKTQHPLTSLLEKKDLLLFNTYYQKIDINSRAEWLSSSLNKAYEENFADFILKDLENIFNSKNVLDKYKLQIFNQLLYVKTENDIGEKFQKIEKILEPLWDKIPPIEKAYSFMGSKYLFNNFYSSGNMSDKEIDAFVNIFKKIKEIGHLEIVERTFSNSFFNEPELAKKLIKNGLSLDKLPTSRYLMEGMKDQDFNIYQIFIELEKNKNNSSYKKIDELDIEKARETLKIIYKHNHDLIFKKDSKDRNILYSALENSNIEIFNLLTIKDLKDIKEKFSDSVILTFGNIYSLSDPQKEKFNLIVSKLLQAEYNFKQTNPSPYVEYPIYYKLFDKVSDVKVLNYLLLSQDIDINKDIQSEVFWNNLKTDTNIKFIKDLIVDDITPENSKKIMRILSSSDSYNENIVNIMNVFPEIHKVKFIDNENILHNAIKNQAYKVANTIVEKYPDLAIEANKQNKMPISYMINNFAKSIKKQNKFNNFELSKHKKLFKGLIGAGLESPNKKSNKILEDQLEKYSIIEETFPEVIKEYQFNKLQRALLDDKTKVSVKKLKI